MLWLARNCIQQVVNVHPNAQYEELSNYVKDLVKNFDVTTHETHDILIVKFQTSKELSNRQDIEDITSSLVKVIPDSTPLILCPTTQFIENRNLRPASFTIIISDETNGVSQLLLAFRWFLF